MSIFFRKRSLSNEDEIVDNIIQIYASERSAEEKMLDYIERQAKTEHEKREMIAALEGFKQSYYYDAMFNGFKKQLFGANKRGCMLTHLELSVCFLVCTKKFYPEVIIDILWIDKGQFRQVVQSLEGKMANHGYKLPASYLEMKPFILEYCKEGFRLKKHHYPPFWKQ